MARTSLEAPRVAWLGGLALVLAAAGCNVSIPKTALDPGAARTIRKIAIVEVRDPKQYFARNQGHPGMLFGAIGGALAGASMESNGAALTQALAADGVSPGRRLTESTAQALAAAGYEIVRLPDLRGEADDEFSLDYAKVQTDADAILNLTLKSAGYRSSTGFDDYTVGLTLTAELVGRSNDRVDRLYFDRFWLDVSDPANPDLIFVEAPAKYRFSSLDDLLKRSREAGAGLEASAELVGRQLARELSRRP
jgi:hypothetical protein